MFVSPLWECLIRSMLCKGDGVLDSRAWIGVGEPSESRGAPPVVWTCEVLPQREARRGVESPTGLTHEITIVRGQGRGGAYAEDRSIRVLGVEPPSVSLLPRRDEYTRVYTTVYPRVHNSIHACTLPRSKYILCRARLYVFLLGIIRRISSDGLGLPLRYEMIPRRSKGRRVSEIMRLLWRALGFGMWSGISVTKGLVRGHT